MTAKKLKTPLILVNFKTYKQATGKKAVALAKKCDLARKKTRTNIILSVEANDIDKIHNKLKIPVLAEHIDYYDYGAHTGSILPETVKEDGAVGTLINHSEKRLSLSVIKKTIERAKKLKLKTIVCASTPKKAEQIAKLKPDFIAIEPPGLIGGNISVSTAKPEIITNTIKRVKKIARIPVLCGAGVKTKQDVEIAIRLGAKGILVASGVTKAKNPVKVLTEFAQGAKLGLKKKK